MKFTGKIWILAIILFTYIANHSYSQNIQLLHNLTTGNTKEIDKAIQSITEAGKYIQEANNYFNESQKYQSDYDIDEKTAQKEMSRAEEKAISLQLKADKLYAETFKSLQKICIESLLNAGEEGLAYKKAADDLMIQAAEKRKEADNVKNITAKSVLLSDAVGFESAAMESYIAALQVEKGISPEVSPQNLTEEDTDDYSSSVAEPILAPTHSNIASNSENLAINQDLIISYQNYINDPSIAEPLMVDRDGVKNIPAANMDTAKNIYLSLFAGDPNIYSAKSITGDQQGAIADTISQLSLGNMQNETDIQQDTYQSSSNIDSQSSSTTSISITDRKLRDAASGEKTNVSNREVVDQSYIMQSSGVRFMVQIAASRSPLTRSQLWAIYPGNLSVEVIEEEGWFKYRIVNFRIFSEANRVALESGVKSAWVVATNDGRPVSLTEAREMTRVMESDVKRYGKKVIKESTDFYLQVAASRHRLNESQLQSLCNSGVCREIIEGGWFKYQIPAGTDYNMALDLKNNYPGKAFITAYQNGTRIKLRKALKVL